MEPRGQRPEKSLGTTVVKDDSEKHQTMTECRRIESRTSTPRKDGNEAVASITFEVFTAVNIQDMVFWDVTLCSLVDSYEHSKEIFWLRLQDTKLH